MGFGLSELAAAAAAATDTTSTSRRPGTAPGLISRSKMASPADSIAPVPADGDAAAWLHRSWDAAVAGSSPPPTTLLIAFGGLAGRLGGPLGEKQGVPPLEFVRTCARAGATHAIFCRDLRQSWYLRGTPEQPRGGFNAVVAALRREIEALRPARVVTLGASMGGYAAVRAALALGADAAVAFSPQVLLDSAERAAACLPPMPFDEKLRHLTRALWVQGVPMPSLSACVGACVGGGGVGGGGGGGGRTALAVHVGGDEPGDVAEAELLRAAAEARGLRCRVAVHTGRGHNLVTELRDEGKLHALLRALLAGADDGDADDGDADDAAATNDDEPAAATAAATATGPAAAAAAAAAATAESAESGPAFWPVAPPPPPSREGLSLAAILRLAAAAAVAAADENGEARLWTSAPRLHLLERDAPAAAALPLRCHVETAVLSAVLSAAECRRALGRGPPARASEGAARRLPPPRHSAEARLAPAASGAERRSSPTPPRGARSLPAASMSPPRAARPPRAGAAASSPCSRRCRAASAQAAPSPRARPACGATRRAPTPHTVLVWLAPPPLLAALWARVAPALRAALGGGAARGLNARLRCYRYRAGDEFLPHHDASQPAARLGADGASVAEDGAARSRWSLLLYLNGAPRDFAGGATVLWPGGEGTPAAARERVQPEAGGGLVFPHGDHPRSLLHAGEAVTAGVKYVIRTDVFA